MHRQRYQENMHAVLFKYLNPHVIAIATETEGRETCQLEICMLTSTHSLMHVLYSYPILASVVHH